MNFRRIFVLSIGFTVFLSNLAFAAKGPNSCGQPGLSEKILVGLAQREFIKRKGTLDRTLQFRVTEDGCDYLVLGEFSPAAPGAYFMVKISRDQSIIYYMPGA